MKDIRYKGIRSPEEDGGAALDEFRASYGIGRIYRVLQKIINTTDERIVRFRVALGTGTGAEFVPLTFEDDGVAFELRTQVPRQFFVGRTGAGPRNVWNPDRFATFSPKMFDTGERTRFDPGFFDHEAGGLFPPQDVEGGDKSQYLDSGGQEDAVGRRGAITPSGGGGCTIGSGSARTRCSRGCSLFPCLRSGFAVAAAGSLRSRDAHVTVTEPGSAAPRSSS